MKELPFKLPAIIYTVSNPKEANAAADIYKESPIEMACVLKVPGFSLNSRVTADKNLELLETVKKAFNGTAISIGAVLETSGLKLSPDGGNTISDMVLIYKQQINMMETMGADFFVIGESFSSLGEIRAAVIAANENSAKPVTVCVRTDISGHTPYGCELLAVLTVLQGMGVSALGISCPKNFNALPEILNKLSAYSDIPLGAVITKQLPDYKEIPEADIVYTDVLTLDCKLFSKVLIKKENAGFKNLNTARKHSITAANFKEAFLLDPTVDISEGIECTSNFQDEILKAENETPGAIKIIVNNEDELMLFEKYQYMIERPLCIFSEIPEYLEKALRVYNGRAVFDGTCDITSEFCDYLCNFYGLIRL